MCKNKFTGLKSKHRKGLTLVELIVAVTILAVALAGIFTVLHVGFSTSARANDLTIASIEAQLWMERLAGLTFDEMNAEIPGWTDITHTATFEGMSDGIWVTLTRAAYDDTDDDINPMLRRITVLIHRSETDSADWHFRHSNIFNVDGTIVS